MSTFDRDPEILVIGAGPTGLMLAGELARRGIRTRIIDKHEHAQDISKALVVQARSLETFDLLGLADQFLRRGYPAPGLNIGLGATNPVSVDMSRLETRFPYLLVLPQRHTEEILEGRLRAHGVSVERKTELVGLEQRADASVAASLRMPDGTASDVKVRYLVGCDGAHSSTRRLLNLPFEGKTHEAIVFLADVKLGAEFVKSRITNFTSRRGFVSILPFLGDYARVFAVDFSKQDRPATDELTLPDLQETVDAILPRRLALEDPRWITRFVSPSRQVPHARIGSVFLAGDAAHAHSPAGGQGMNTGLQDAFNLGWKLAMVMRSAAPPQLLESYNAERHPIGARAQRQTDRMFASFVLRNPVLKKARDATLHALVPLPAVQRKLANDLSGIGINYRFTARSRAEHLHGRRRSFLQAGDRMPDAELWVPGQPTQRLFELVRHHGYVLITFVCASQLVGYRPRLSSFLDALTSEADWVRPVVVLDEGLPEEVRRDVIVLVDFKGHLRDRAGVSHGSVLLLRPDGYVAFHRSQVDPETILRALTPWALSRSPQSQTGANVADPSLELAAVGQRQTMHEEM